jgi:hypothetical protein
MRALFWVTLVLCAVAPAPLVAQGRGPAVARPIPMTSVLLPHPRLNALEWQGAADSVKRRPFYLPRPGEQVAYWLGFGTGVALSPLAWCHGQDCGVLRNASRSLLLGGVGAISGLLLKRAF